VKGRCSGVSLFIYHHKYVFCKRKETLPGANKRVCYLRNFLKREAPHYTCPNGSLTVEASIIVPLFACFFAFILFFFRVMEVQLLVQDALEETGRGLAVLASKETEETVESIDYLIQAEGLLLLNLKNDELIQQYVSGGITGISLLTSDFSGDDILLRANYVMRFPVRLFGIQDFLVCQSARYRKWNGWHGIWENGSAVQTVYVTEYGEVYHLHRDCAYLDLSIRKVAYVELEHLKNKNKESYDACEKCGNQGNKFESVYITDYGDCYHYTLSCSGLKRTIYQKQLSETGGLPACSKCSK